MSIMDNVQPAVKKETGKVAAITGIGLILMWIVFGGVSDHRSHDLPDPSFLLCIGALHPDRKSVV